MIVAADTLAASSAVDVGRNVAILVEVAARNQLLRTRGHHAARKLVDRLNRQLATDGETSDNEGDLGDDI